MSLELSSIAPVIEDAAELHLSQFLSRTFYNQLVSDFTNSTLSPAQTALLPFVRRPCALLTMYEYAKIGGVQMGESGMHRTETESRKAAYRYQEKQYSEYMLEKGYDACEVLLRFLSDNATNYPTWRDSDEGAAHRAAILSYATDFRRLAQLQCDRYSFECLRPMIATVETFAVAKQLPKAFWNDFRAKHIANTLSTAEKTLRGMIQSAIVHRAIEEAQKMHWVTVKAGRVYVQEEFGEQSQVNRTMPTGIASGMYIHQQVWGDRRTWEWAGYMYDNPTAFPLVFDVASGGTNPDADAWHINSASEQEAASTAEAEAKNRPIYRF